LGGNHITNDISQGLHIDFAAAERIKTFYGGVLATGMDDKDVIDLRSNTGDWEHDTRSVSRADIIGIVRPRVEEILEEVKRRLDLAGFDFLPSQRVVLTGGGSQLAGFDGLASKILGQQVRLGRPIRIQGLPHSVTGPAFSSCVGATLFSANPQDEWWDFGVPSANYPTKSIKRVTKWFKENW
jgi:cell division protein FtsA